jgi:hypothetical protein
MIFTPRLLTVLWQGLYWHGLLKDNPDAPSKEAFIAHYTGAHPEMTLSWVDRAEGRSFLYDLSVNQAQVTPAGPLAKEIDKLNKWLWKVLPPQLLEEPVDWHKHWFDPASHWDVPKMQVILDQGFDVNALDENGENALCHAVQPFGGSLAAVTFLVEAGIRLDNIESIIRMGSESVTGPGEANEQHLIENYLRSKLNPPPAY